MADQPRDFNHIREWIVPKLEAGGWSVENFARECGLSRAIIYFYMNDRYRPDEQQMITMCRVLGVPSEEGFAQYTPRHRGRAFGFRPKKW